SQFVDAGCCEPEPGERLAFLVGLVIIPATLFLVLLLLSSSWLTSHPRLQGPARFALNAGFASFLLALCFVMARAGGYHHIRLNAFYEWPILGVLSFALLLLAVWYLGRAAVMRWVTTLLALALVLLVLLASVQTDKSDYTATSHFSAVFTSVVQVHRGKAL